MNEVVAIVGRPNVGKSSLFNRIIGERKSITDDASGVTRDRIYAKTSWLDQKFSVIDTGGIIIKDEPFSKEIRIQAEIAIQEADLIIMIVDVRVGIIQEDIDVANLLKRSKKPIILAVNKVDDNSFKDQIYEFYSLGIENIIPISSLHGIGIGDLLDLTIKLLPERKIEIHDPSKIYFSIVGQPNVGKSTLLNSLVGENRVIVSSTPNTTRDAIDIEFEKEGIHYVAIDTAGIRKQNKIFERAEKYSVLRAINAIEKSDIVLLVLDGTEEINEQDKRIVGYALDYNRALIIVVNKWDAVEKDSKSMNNTSEKIRKQFQFLEYVPIIFVSALHNKRINLLTDSVKVVYENYIRHVQTNVLNDIILDACLLNQPPIFNGNRLKISYATQSDIKPPTFVLFVNDEKHMHFSYLRYLENKIRENFSFEGCPIKIILRKKE
ncbi:MAG: ribosome biogenesis GTPase Der [Bacilli bacterium]|nr:ribosome biogenesis GTPase Der [Bacilli bacterium]